MSKCASSCSFKEQEMLPSIHRINFRFWYFMLLCLSYILKRWKYKISTFFLNGWSSGGSFTPNPGIHITKESGIFWRKFHPKPWHAFTQRVWDVLLEASPQSPPSLPHLSANSAATWRPPPPEMLKAISTGFLNCPPGNRCLVFLVSLFHLLPGVLENHPGVLCIL